MFIGCITKANKQRMNQEKQLRRRTKENIDFPTLTMPGSEIKNQRLCFCVFKKSKNGEEEEEEDEEKIKIIIYVRKRTIFFSFSSLMGYEFTLHLHLHIYIYSIYTHINIPIYYLFCLFYSFFSLKSVFVLLHTIYYYYYYYKNDYIGSMNYIMNK